MSIISEALKKADHLKKWKAVGAGSPDSSDVLQNQAVLTLEEPVSIPANRAEHEAPMPSDPPFRVHFERKPTSKQTHFFSTAQLIAIILVTCSFFALIVGPWLYMWFHQTSQKSEQSIPKVISNANHGATHTSSTDLETSKSNADNIHVAMMPIPKSFKQIPLEMQYRLSGTSSVNGERYAVINSKLLRAGESIDGAEVITIEDQRATLKKGSDEFIVKLGGNS